MEKRKKEGGRDSKKIDRWRRGLGSKARREELML